MNSNSRFFFALCSAASAIGIGSVFVYQQFSFRITGLFFIPYLIALIMLGAPLLLLEFSIGQYFDRNVVDLFASIKKPMSGIGWLAVFNAFIAMCYYSVILSWHIIYIFVSLGMQWKNDANNYFMKNVLQSSNGFNGFAQFSLPVFIALIISWIIVFFYIRKGFDGMKKMFVITSFLFVMLLLFFFAYSLSLENALKGIYSFFKPDFKALLRPDTWLEAFLLAAVSLGLSFGVMPAIARKSEKGFAVGNSFFVVVFKLLISISAGFVIFGILGFLSAKNGMNFDKIDFTAISLPFTSVAQALPFFYKPTLISILFFMLLSIIILMGTCALAYSISHVLVHKFKTRHRNAAVIVVGMGFLFGLAFIIKPGYYIMGIVNHFFYYNILIALLLESLAIGWFFDAEKISDFINKNSTLKIGNFWRYWLKYFVPLMLIFLLAFQIKKDHLLNYNNYPLFAVLAFGIGAVAVPLIAAFLMPQKLLDRR